MIANLPGLSSNEKGNQIQHNIIFTSPYLSSNGKIEAAGPIEIGVNLLMACIAGSDTNNNACPNACSLDL